jgi:hypothetical protein
MHHLDVAGGTGDVAFRVLRTMREDQVSQQEQQESPGVVPLGEVNVCDINPAMLLEGRKKARDQRLGVFLPLLSGLYHCPEDCHLTDVQAASQKLRHILQYWLNDQPSLAETHSRCHDFHSTQWSSLSAIECTVVTA